MKNRYLNRTFLYLYQNTYKIQKKTSIRFAIRKKYKIKTKTYQINRFIQVWFIVRVFPWLWWFIWPFRWHFQQFQSLSVRLGLTDLAFPGWFTPIVAWHLRHLPLHLRYWLLGTRWHFLTWFWSQYRIQYLWSRWGLFLIGSECSTNNSIGHV